MFLEKEMRFSFFKIKNRSIFDNALGTSGKRQYAHTNFVDFHRLSQSCLHEDMKNCLAVVTVFRSEDPASYFVFTRLFTFLLLT